MRRAGAPGRRRWRRRPWGAYLLAAAAALLVLTGLSVIPALAAGRAMSAGRESLADGQQRLLDGDVAGAREAFNKARGEFDDASGSAGNILIRVESWIPFLGRTPDAVRGLARIGSDISAAGVEITAGVSELPDGLDSLAPRHGVIPVGAAIRLAPAVRRARTSLDDAQRVADGLPHSLLLPPVEEAAGVVRDKLRGAVALARSADALLRILPEFAGENGTRRYFVAAQNPAELRGTGGLIGEYAILTASEGRLSLGRFRDIKTLRNLTPESGPPLPKDLPDIYGTDPASFWTSTNVMPDVPTAASLIENLYARVGHGRLDGTIFVDPQALPYLLQATGPVRSRELGVTLDSKNVVSYVTNDAYFQFGDESGARKEALGVAAGDIWREFVAHAPPEQALRALVGAGASGNITIHSTNSAVEDGLETAGIAGEFRATVGDFLGMTMVNWAGNKVDYYMRPSARYDISLGPHGSATATAVIELENQAPKHARPGYALGPFEGESHKLLHLGPGDDYGTVSLYCPDDCLLNSMSENGKPIPVGPYFEQGLRLYTMDLRIGPQQTNTYEANLELPSAWEGDAGGGTYRLRLDGQPTIKPITADVTIHIPDGMHVTGTSDPDHIKVEGTTVTWSGEIGKWTDLEVSFERPLATRVWARAWDFLNKPVIKL